MRDAGGNEWRHACDAEGNRISSRLSASYADDDADCGGHAANGLFRLVRVPRRCSYRPGQQQIGVIAMAGFRIAPRDIPKTGDETPAGSLLGYIWRMSGPHQFWLCLLALVVAGLSMIPLELQRRLIDDAVRGGNLDLLAGLVAIYLGVLLVQGGTKFILRMYQGWLSESAVRYNREHLARLHESRGGSAEDGAEGRVVSVVGTEVDKLGGFVGEGLSQPFVNLGMLVAVAGYMLTVEPAIALFSLAFLVPLVIAVPIVQRYINTRIAERVSLIRDLSDSLVALPQDGSDLGRTDIPGLLDETYVNRMKTFVLKFGLKALVNLLNALTPLSVLAVGGYLVIQGETTIGVVVAFISGFDRLAGPLRELIAYYRLAAHANVQHKMIADWMT